VRTHLSALGNTAASTTVAGTLMLTVLVITAAPAQATAVVSAATPLREGAGMTGRPSADVLALQRALRERGYDLGAPGVDGRFGALTAAAVRRFQAEAGLPADGIVGRSTRRVLDARRTTATLRLGVGMGRRSSVRVRRLQQMLERSGFDVGPPGADGRFGPLTAAAVHRMQEIYGLTPDAIVGSKTRRVLSLIVDRRSVERKDTRNRGGAHHTTAHQVTDNPSALPSGPTERQGSQRQPTKDARVSARHADTPSRLAVALLAVLLSAVALAVALLRRPRVLADRSDGPSGRDGDVGRRGSRGLRQQLRNRDRARARPPLVVAAPEGAIGHVTLDGQGRVSGESLEKIYSACDEAGWQVQRLVYDDEVPGLFARHGLTYAFERITGGHARALVVGDIKRLASSASDLATLLESFRSAGAVLVAADLELDTATVEGRRAASAIIILGTSQRDNATESPGSDRATVPTLGTNGTTS
jgi:peptidoglycan hydrolase-like protein with peptidoglycan-binding domain